MAHWIRGGGEQTLTGPAKRTYAEHLVPPLLHDPDKRRRIRHLAADIPECDIPYRSIEPCDDAPPAIPLPRQPLRPDTEKEKHVFYILYEEDVPQDRLRDIESPSPRPPRARDMRPYAEYRDDNGYPVHHSRAPKHWTNGAHLRTNDDDRPYPSPGAYTPSPPTHGTPPQWARYQDWRERNCAYDMAADEEAESYSPFPAVEAVAAAPASGHGSGHDHPPPHPHAHDHPSTNFISDDEAADNVTAHLAAFMRRYPTSRQERILRGLIHPKSGTGVADFELDDDALTNIMRTANDLFFGGRLRSRVQWDWSNTSSDAQYDAKIIGHTSLRAKRAKNGGGAKKDAGAGAAAAADGIETFVLLSTPILKNRAYSRRLLISAFLHELVHCYLFICCGWTARRDGGHTDGFRRIADTIDQWAGRGKLFLCHVEADLEQFRQAPLTEAPKKAYVLDQRHHVCRPADYVYCEHGHEQAAHGWARHRRHEW